jgi:hypothetical protein
MRLIRISKSGSPPTIEHSTSRWRRFARFHSTTAGAGLSFAPEEPAIRRLEFDANLPAAKRRAPQLERN